MSPLTILQYKYISVDVTIVYLRISPSLTIMLLRRATTSPRLMLHMLAGELIL